MCCILSKFYIKPQQQAHQGLGVDCCILSKFYIKPQQNRRRFDYDLLYLIEILHQTTTDLRAERTHQSCILSKFYIKPQLEVQPGGQTRVVSYRNSTSNHNFPAITLMLPSLYLIEILHQTTTSIFVGFLQKRLYLIEILHQTTTEGYP